MSATAEVRNSAEWHADGPHAYLNGRDSPRGCFDAIQGERAAEVTNRRACASGQSFIEENLRAATAASATATRTWSMFLPNILPRAAAALRSALALCGFAVVRWRAAEGTLEPTEGWSCHAGGLAGRPHDSYLCRRSNPGLRRPNRHAAASELAPEPSALLPWPDSHTDRRALVLVRRQLEHGTGVAAESAAIRRTFGRLDAPNIFAAAATAVLPPRAHLVRPRRGPHTRATVALTCTLRDCPQPHEPLSCLAADTPAAARMARTGFYRQRRPRRRADRVRQRPDF